ncbi:hypothetical protein SLE2022_002840 [Rubroshorea leprosula]
MGNMGWKWKLKMFLLFWGLLLLVALAVHSNRDTVVLHCLFGSRKLPGVYGGEGDISYTNLKTGDVDNGTDLSFCHCLNWFRSGF